MVKTCKGCGTAKPKAEFYPHPDTKDGYFGKCKVCVRAAQAVRDAKDRPTDRPKLGRSGRLPTIPQPHYCSICGTVALYQAKGGRYACRAHRDWLIPFVKAEMGNVIKNLWSRRSHVRSKAKYRQ